MQKLFWSWKDDDLTFDLDRWLLGLLVPSKYRGFDFSPTADWNLTLNHETTGFLRVKGDQTYSDKTGVILSNQGVVIQEDEAVVLPITPVSTLPRIDLVICTHEYTDSIEGGYPATYSVVEGTPNASPVAPTVPDAKTDVIIGTLYLPASATNLTTTGVVFTPVVVPNLANKADKLIESPNGSLSVALTALKASIDITAKVVEDADLDLILTTGIFSFTGEPINVPDGVLTAWGVVSRNGDLVMQSLVSQRDTNAGEDTYTRSSADAGVTWSAWTRLVNSSGDKLGIKTVALDNALSHYKNFRIGVDEQHEVFNGASITLTRDFVINLQSTIQDGITEVLDGAEWKLQFKQPIILNGFNLVIKTGATAMNPDVTGTVLKIFSALEVSSFVRDKGLMIYAAYDKEGTSPKWNVYHQFTDTLGDRYKCVGTTDVPHTSDGSLGTVITFNVPEGMSYTPRVRIVAIDYTGGTIGEQWVEGTVLSYASTAVSILIDSRSGGSLEISDWLLNIGGANSIIMNSKVYASAGSFANEIEDGSSDGCIIWETGTPTSDVGTSNFDTHSLTTPYYAALRLASRISDLFSALFDSIAYGERPNTTLLPQTSGLLRFNYFKAPKTANYKCKIDASCIINVNGGGGVGAEVTFLLRKRVDLTSPEILVGETNTVQATVADPSDLKTLTMPEVIVSLNQDEILQVTYVINNPSFGGGTHVSKVTIDNYNFSIEEV